MIRLVHGIPTAIADAIPASVSLPGGGLHPQARAHLESWQAQARSIPSQTTWEEQWKDYFHYLLRNPTQARQVVLQWREQANVLEHMLNERERSVSCVHPDLVGHA